MGVPVEVGPGESFECVAFGEGSGPCADACQIIGVAGGAVVSVSECDYSVVPSVSFGEVVGEVIGLAAGVEEKDRIEVVSQLFAQFLGVFALVGVRVVRGYIQKFLFLGLVYFGNSGMRVADVHAGDAAH